MTTPVWIQKWDQWTCATTGASVVPDGSTSTNITLLVDDPGAGQQIRIQRVTAVAAPATDTPDNGAGMLRYYRKRSGTLILLHEEPAAVVGRTAAVPGASVTWKEPDGDPVCVLKEGDQLYVASEIADPWHWNALGGWAPVA